MERTLVSELSGMVGKTVTLQGWLHWKRDLGGIQFALLRDRSGIVQLVVEKDVDLPIAESAMEVRGQVVQNAKAPGGLEVLAQELQFLARALEPSPIEIPKEEWRANPETLLEYRYVSLRGEKARATLKVQAALVRGFRQYLDAQGFTEIFTPKIVSAGAEGGSNLFPIDYFEQRAYLAQSPQLYKQIMVGVYERVYEVAPVFRAEQHATSRHLNEYLSLDVEMGFIRDENEVMDLEENLLRAMLEEARRSVSSELELLGAEWPNLTEMPRLEHAEARRILREELSMPVGQDFNEEAERALGAWAKERWGVDFLFVSKYPEVARPFYAYPEGDGRTRGFDLLFRGLEITSGGQRVHEHRMLVEQLEKKGNDPANFAGYLEVFKFGMPPHGGFAIGAERLTQKLLGLPNVRYARAFPRDRHRLTP
ncbi:aspartate--tRNA(Asn) ligase [Meiothermus granaticius]|uniref:Aspartate--tRNA(Asp/Asn) ligase n=1 Tax=Meiothermus granaticius NBRC 107808 TaxID=1227551 RepID=A0A399FA99_9DEIN|nr:aspartate--tRNA(Asn) ligase [Meiothermus granaticius]MCL6525877.1 aspartate--tRNA(Asn) ligase [Thermaceae bacterium]RIH92189.1 Aspartate--tRNA(Asp/Asn) ligase [Meiothermus granaticius NBRC 107808]GEM85633.1 aspartate--tRNA(Asp/Asn) ligase [Meiothermus granaticius NBRC 107808]